MTDVIDETRRVSPVGSPWRNEIICKRVKELWKDHTATQIACKLWTEFRVSVTRNSVVGYLHRAKITVEQKAEVHPKTNNAPRIMPRSAVNVQTVRAARAPKFKPEPFVPVCVEVEPLHIALADLKDEMCRFPFGDDPVTVTYCGHPSLTGRSWCPKHFRVVTVPTPPRRSSYVAPTKLGGQAA